jgi:hypothetical protein
VAWVPREAAKVMPRKTPARSSWRIWDPGRSEAHVVLRGVIVRTKHAVYPYSGVRVYKWYTYMSPMHIGVHSPGRIRLASPSRFASGIA